MSASNDEDKETHKSVPVRTADGKAPFMMSSHSFRAMRVLAQGISSCGSQSISGPTIITTNIVPQAVLKQVSETNRNQGVGSNSTTMNQGTTSITLQRPTQITLSNAPVSAQNIHSGATYHVPRGPAVVANLAAPRGNITSVRSPMIVTAQSANQSHSFAARPARTPSPAQGTAWLNTNTSNGSQIKGAPTVLSSPVRGATVTGKPQLISRGQSVTSGVQTIRPASGIQHSAITIGQSGQQIHSFKSNQGSGNIQALGNTVTIAQALPARTQTIVYNSGSTNQFITASRLTVAPTIQNQRQQQILRPTHTTTTKVAVPAGQIASNRIINAQGAVLTPATRIASISTQPTTQTSSASAIARVATTQPMVTINRLTMANNNNSQVTTVNNLGQARILHSLVAVASSQGKTIQNTAGAKVITQSTPGTIHLTPLTTPIKTTQSTITAVPRTINVPAALVAQRPTAVVSTQAIPIVKALTNENQQNSNVFIHATVPSSVSHRPASSPTGATQNNCLVTTTAVAAYTISGGSYFYDTSGTYTIPRSFNQQSNHFSTVSQSTQPMRTSALGNQVHNITQQQQQVRYNSVMVVDQTRGQPFAPQPTEYIQEQVASKTTAVCSPRPSILRKRDHEGTIVKNSKNPITTAQQSNLPPHSPPSPPQTDLQDNGNSSGGSTTISATSSPGLAEVNDDSLQAVIENHKEEEEAKPPVEMSPRKKPRKQQLTGNDMDDNNDDMQFITENSLKKEEESDGHSDEPKDGAPEARQIAPVRKPASASLLNGYKQTWKATHNHFVRHSDVKPKEEKKPSIIDLANQNRVQEKVNGWKIHHLSTQIEDIIDQETSVYDSLSDMLKYMEKEQEDSNCGKNIERINELIKGNLQRIKIINEGLTESKSQMMRIFEHKPRVQEIISRCASKRNFKKREKS